MMLWNRVVNQSFFSDGPHIQDVFALASYPAVKIYENNTPIKKCEIVTALMHNILLYCGKKIDETSKASFPTTLPGKT